MYGNGWPSTPVVLKGVVVMLMVGLVRRDLRSGSIYSMVGLVYTPVICERVVVVMVGPLA